MIVTAIDFIWTSHTISIAVRDSSRYIICFNNICRSSLPIRFSLNYFRDSNKYSLNIFFAVYQGSGPNFLNGCQIKLLLKSIFSRRIKRICFALHIYYLVKFFLVFIYQASIWKGVVAKSSMVPQRSGKVMR